jgi:hypothetical protein
MLNFMDEDRTEAPAYWVEELARSEEEVARGERVPASVVHEDMLRAIAELEAEVGCTANASVRDSRGH